MTSHALSTVFLGVKAVPVDVQVHIATGLPALNIVGMADKSVSESKERVRAAFSSMGIIIPAKRITINLSPSDLSKEGSHFDLPIALAILSAMDCIPNTVNLADYVTLGELSLNGDIKSVKGVLPAMVLAVNQKKSLIFPQAQIKEVYLFSNRLNLVPSSSLQNLIDHFNNKIAITMPQIDDIKESEVQKQYYDFSDIKGQETGKRALEIAAAGSHNMLMIGPPGVGKSMLASAIQGVLPPLSKKDILDVSLIYSLAGMLDDNFLITKRPYRSPHHTASEASLIGGGRKLKLGEITLAHNGVLFLDELAELNKQSLNSLREPLENGVINIARVNSRFTLPADFQLIAAMNPCRCGYFGDINRQCKKAPACSEEYQNKISGPLFDRIDITVELGIVEPYKLDKVVAENSLAVKARVMLARKIQEQRYKNEIYSNNSKMSGSYLEDVIKQVEQNPKAKSLISEFFKKFKLSMRSYVRILKVARTIADIEGQESVNAQHIGEALSYRRINYNNL